MKKHLFCGVGTKFDSSYCGRHFPKNSIKWATNATPMADRCKICIKAKDSWDKYFREAMEKEKAKDAR